MLHTWKPQLKRCYSLIEPSATSTSTRLFNWIFLSCQRDRHPFYACCVWLLVFCTFARFHGICLGNKVARARIKVMNGFPRGPTTTSILVTSSSIQKWIWPGLTTNLRLLPAETLRKKDQPISPRHSIKFLKSGFLTRNLYMSKQIYIKNCTPFLRG